ncbi:hypothetical protein BD408DRAFT_421453 [Parasitella parasitica]|nr:hypothetical protein BD408DRAFT_421453 [Parasitella parasitica]
MFLQTRLAKPPLKYISNSIAKLAMSSSSSFPADVPIKPVLALPSTADETVQVDINDTYKLNELGPVVINENGTMSRINNWFEMNEIERANVKRVLLERNRKRLAKLKEAAVEEESK